MKKRCVVHFLPAKAGDCLVLEFSNKECILIDGGYKSTYYEYLKPLLQELHSKEYIIKLVVVTHYDLDHIAGLLAFIEDNGYYDNPNVIRVENIWFNSVEDVILNSSVFEGHLASKTEKTVLRMININKTLYESMIPNDENEISVRDAICFKSLCLEFGYRINENFSNGLIYKENNKAAIKLGDFNISVLGPQYYNINELAILIDRELRKKLTYAYNARIEDLAGMISAMLIAYFNPTYEEREVCIADSNINSVIAHARKSKVNAINRSSIVLKIEYEGLHMLFCGDSDSSIWGDEIENKYDLIKISHHGTYSPNEALLNKTVSKILLFSTNGNKKNIHPDDSCVALALKNGFKGLYFNYELKRKNIYSQWALEVGADVVFGENIVEVE